MLVDAAMGVVSRSVAYRAGFKISDVRVDAVAPVCPILLVHGSKDTFVETQALARSSRTRLRRPRRSDDEGGKHDSRRPDDVLVDCAAFLLDHLVGEPAAVPELRAALTLTRGLGRPPFASSTNFTSGADANRQKAVRATLTRGGRSSGWLTRRLEYLVRRHEVPRGGRVLGHRARRRHQSD